MEPSLLLGATLGYVQWRKSQSATPAPKKFSFVPDLGGKYTGSIAPLRIIECKMPDGISVGKTPYGLGIFATKRFKKGDVLYRGSYITLDPIKATDSKVIILKTDAGGEYTLDVYMHTVSRPDGKRELFYFDGFMNHCCDPTTISTECEGEYYNTEAARDIEVGEEITCDYDLFEWDSRDKGIEKCGCGAAKCRGKALGFKFLDPELQKVMIKCAYEEVTDAWEAAGYKL